MFVSGIMKSIPQIYSLISINDKAIINFKMKLIITGATGMVGSEVLRQAISDNDIESITIIVRRATDITHPKLKTILHQNFLDYSNLTDVFKNNDAVIWCLGISQNQVNKEEYIKITYDYTVAFARDMLNANSNLAFLFFKRSRCRQHRANKNTVWKNKGQNRKRIDEDAC
jgi:nucleoside-diphosphate-sugar epimerase